MKRIINLSIILFLCFFLLAEAIAADPYFAFEESFALSRTPVEGSYPIISFIPRTMLLYITNRDEITKISGRDYLKATTQDGVEVFVDATTVSRNTFENTIGSHEIIFNSAKRLCREIGCNKEVPEQVWKVHAGDAFKKYNSATSGFYKLEGIRYGQQIIGYIKDDELEELALFGAITLADKKHPKYKITKKSESKLSTKCGEIVKKGTVKKLGVGVEIDSSILSAFGFGIKAGIGADVTSEITKEYGGSDKKISFILYNIKNMRTDEKTKLVAQIVYKCEQGPLIDTLKTIERVDIRNPETKKTYSLAFKEFNTPDDLSKYTGYPYFFSVNSYKQYLDIMERLGNTFEDRCLAGFFLSEFNRSCKSKYRSKPKATAYSYRE